MIGILAVLALGFHLWFRAHAIEIIEDLVESRSKGKISLKIEKLRFGYFSNKIEIEKAVFVNTDSGSTSTSYRFSIDKIRMKGKGLIPLLFSKELFIDTLSLTNPVIEVNRLREVDKAGKRKDISIPEEMGKIYSSIQDAIEVLQVKKFKFENATFILANKTEPNQKPVRISNLHLDIDNLKVDSSRSRVNEKMFFSDNIVLRTHNQDITFPDGRHKLSFSRFRINLKNKLVEFDSCTIAATRTDSTASSFTIFFDALLMTNIDFDTLYRHEVIKADSVYCVNPKFNLLAVTDTKAGIKKNAPKLENIIQQLTGDLDLNHVVVANADFNIQTIKDGIPNSFIFSKNNFEMEGLSIDKNAEKPLKVKSFTMAIRNYENFIKDSTYSIQFDSILFRNDNLILSRFLFNKLNKGKILNTFSIPQFNLSGLSWNDLVFDRIFKAEAATMYNPYIRYSTPPDKKKRKNIFQSLAAVNEFMDLKQLKVVDGTIDLTLKEDLKIQLQKATFSVSSQSLLSSTRFSGIRNSLDGLFFENGMVQINNLSVKLKDTRYNGTDGSFAAGEIAVKSGKEDLDMTLSNVRVKELQANEVTGNIYADGVLWEQGYINLKADSLSTKEKMTGAIIDITNVSGKNTTINILSRSKTIRSTLSKISFVELVKDPENKLLLEGSAFAGDELEISDSSLTFTLQNYEFTDGKTSSASQVRLKNSSGSMTTDILVPALQFVIHIKPFIDKHIIIDELILQQPVVNLHLHEQKNKGSTARLLNPIIISQIKLEQPIINFKSTNAEQTISVQWNSTQNNFNTLRLNNIDIRDYTTSVNNLTFSNAGLKFVKQDQLTFNSGQARSSGTLNNIRLNYGNNTSFQWSALLSDFYSSNLLFDSIGKDKSNLDIKTVSLNNLQLNSGLLKKLQFLTAANDDFRVKEFTGSYSSIADEVKWFNAAFDKKTKTFSLDSASYRPSLERDSFIARQSYQVDYITARSGAVTISGFDINRFINKNELVAGIAQIEDFHFTDFKDKRLPFNTGLIKPLPVGMLKKIQSLVSIDTILLKNAAVDYTEIMVPGNKVLVVPVTRMNARLLNLKNYEIKKDDSLSIQATGYLLDTMLIKLKVKQSYTDSLEGFLLTVQANPADMRLLNPIFIPAASMKMESGLLDTMNLRVIGREYLAQGEMDMFYHDLKIRVLKDGDTTKKSFWDGIKNFIANSFVIRSRNKSRTNPVFFIRNRDKSAINYLVKIVLNGFQTSIGAKNPKKEMKKYRQELKKRKLPPIEID
jgi:hypothetical protein